MKTLNYIDTIINPSILHDRINHHVDFGKNEATNHLNNTHAKPFVIKSSKGVTLTDTDNNKFIDFNLSQGANILGHTPVKVLDSIEEALWDGINQEMPTLVENLLAESIKEAMPSMEQVRLMNSGIEAVNDAIRLARAYTGKRMVIKFGGSFHGNPTQFNLSSKGIPVEFTKLTVSLPYNNQDAIAETFLKYQDDIAAIIVEPVPSSIGVVLPKAGFLQFLRELTFKHRSLLIFDEITTGFRPRITGAQGYFGITPDLTVLGKIVGGGFPVGAFGGKSEIMSSIECESEGSMHSITATAGLATLKRLKSPLFYETLNHKSRDFTYWLQEISKDKGIVVNSFQSMFSIFFSDKEITNYNDVKNSDVKRFNRFTSKLLDEGVYLSQSRFEANFVSMAHLPEDLNRMLEVMFKVLKRM